MIAGIVRDIRSSFYDPAFYGRAAHRSLKHPIRAFAALALVSVAIHMLVLLVAMVTIAFSPVLARLEAAYPDDLVVTFAHGEMSINQPSPYYIKNTVFANDTTKNLAVFDGNDNLTGGLDVNSTYLLFKKSYVITGGDQSRASAYALESTTTIAKSNVVSLIERVRPYFVPGLVLGGIVVAVCGTILGALFWTLFHALYVVVPAVVILGISAFGARQLSFREAYGISLYATIPAMIFSIISSLLFISWPFLTYTLLVLFVAAINSARAQYGRQGLASRD